MTQANTKTELDELFSLMGIECVVCVDDQYRAFSDETVNDVIGDCAELGTEKVLDLSTKLPELKNIPFALDEDIWQKELRKLWGELDGNKREDIYNLFRRERTGDALMDKEAAGALKKLLTESSTIQYQELSFTEWRKDKNKYLTEENVAKTLFLFDQDLSTEEGGTSNEGIKIIKDVLAKWEKATCGLLSHLFTTETEMTEWEAFSDRHQIDKDRFILISKSRLKGKKDNFLRSLMLTVLNNHCKNLKKKVSKIIKKASEGSLQEIEDLSIYDFEDIVFRSSISEGIWEPDTLFRLHGLFHRDAARLKAKSDKELHQLANKIRSITMISANLRPTQADTSWKIHRRELYEDGDHINSLYMPIELGDIFEKTSGEKKFILIAQPCDLMIRSDGKRKYTVHDVILAEIEKPEKPSDEHKTKTLLEPNTFYKLLYFDENTGDEHLVNFGKTHTVKLCILDLCVYQPDGSAKISVGQNCPDIVIPTWKSHFKYLGRDFDKIINRYKELEGLLKTVPKKANKAVLSMVLPKSSNGKKALFRENILQKNNETTISYDCRRISRLCQPRAGDMLMKYAQYISRMAFEHDLSRDISS